MSQSNEVGSMVEGMTVEDTAASSVCSNEVYQDMNISSETFTFGESSGHMKGVDFINNRPPEIVSKKIEYDDDNYENVNKEELLQHLARPPMAVDKNVPRSVQKKKRYVALKMTASNRPRKNPKQSVSRKPKPAKNTAEYVPLAIAEKKKDEYYF